MMEIYLFLNSSMKNKCILVDLIPFYSFPVSYKYESKTFW